MQKDLVKKLAKEEIVTKKPIPKILMLCCLLVGLSLSACSRSTSIDLSYPIGSIWTVPVADGKADWEAASVLAQEQYTGFSLANEGSGFDVYPFSEGNKQDDVQTAVRAMVEGQAEGADDPVAAIFGATSNEATTRTAALANFFNVPMIVPSASGDNLLPENNLWAFELSPPNSAYAEHILGTVLNKQVMNADFEEGFEPEFRIAILYEQNTYGETAAVSTATMAMEQAYSIHLYDKFPAENPSASRLRALVNLALDEDVQLVFMISSNPDVAVALTRTFEELSDARLRPLLVGMAAGFTSQKFMDSEQASSAYVLRQEIDRTNCPAEIESLYAAQNYAAVNLLAAAVEDVNAKLSAEKNTFSINPSSEKITLYRESLRDALKIANLTLPCLGQVSFNNAGQNRSARFEIITTETDQLQIIATQDFVDIVKNKINLTFID